MEKKDIVNRFVSEDCMGHRYILGRNENSLALSKVIDITGYVDDFAAPGSIWNNKPVIHGDHVPAGSIIVNCSMSISPVTSHKRLEKIQNVNVLAYADLFEVFPSRLSLPEFIVQTRDDVLHNGLKWNALRDSLSDDISKRVLDDILAYRLSGDYRAMSNYSVRLQDQYFEDFLNCRSSEIFVDAGGYDGDTTEEFCKRYPDYSHVYFFEPSPKNIDRAKARLQSYHNIDFIPLGISNSEGTLWFNPDDGSASRVNEISKFQIKVTTLDGYITGKVSFIKMDLEGWELKALEGAQRHIIEDYPKLAIAVYHHSSDFWRVYEYISELRDDYNIFIRHYTEGWSETIMFFVPQ